MGSILAVRDEVFGRRVAMKVLLCQDRTLAPVIASGKARFLEEARLTGMLEHPAIVPVHDLGHTSDDRPYFTMKLVEGESFGTILRGVASGDSMLAPEWPLRRRLGVLLRVCEAVSYAHSKGVVHRDIKPDNVMVGAYGEVLLMDWGLASQLHAEADISSSKGSGKDGEIVGTPAYMSPEQARGESARIDPRTDVFALGAMLFEILTGRPPYEGPTCGAVIAMAAKACTDCQKILSGVPRELRAICSQAMHPDPARRYASVVDFAAAVEAYLDNRFIPEYRISPLSRVLQSIGVIVCILFGIKAFSPAGSVDWLIYIDGASLSSVLLMGFIYFAIVHGWTYSLSFRKRCAAGPIGATVFMETLLEGFFWGGVVTTLIGLVVFLMVPDGVFRYPEHYIFLEVLLMPFLYFLALHLDARIGYVRRLRHCAFFGLISAGDVSRVVKLALLLITTYACAFAFLARSGGLIFVLEATGGLGAIPSIVIRCLAINLLAFLPAVLSFRLVFRFGEFWAALSHLFSFLAGGEVNPRNRVHAAAVLRYFAEAQALWLLAYGLLGLLGATLAELMSGEMAAFGLSLWSSLAASLSGIVLFVTVAGPLSHAFAGNGSRIRDYSTVDRFLSELEPDTLMGSGLGKYFGLTISLLLAFGSIVYVLLACGVEFGRPSFYAGILLSLPFYANALMHRARWLRSIRQRGRLVHGRD
jgi:serine/threonine protein kinase